MPKFYAFSHLVEFLGAKSVARLRVRFGVDFLNVLEYLFIHAERVSKNRVVEPAFEDDLPF